MASSFFQQSLGQPQRPIGLRPREAAKTLGVSESTLRRLTKSGELRCIKLDRVKLYAYSELERWAIRRTAGA